MFVCWTIPLNTSYCNSYILSHAVAHAALLKLVQALPVAEASFRGLGDRRPQGKKRKRKKGKKEKREKKRKKEKKKEGDYEWLQINFSIDQWHWKIKKFLGPQEKVEMAPLPVVLLLVSVLLLLPCGHPAATHHAAPPAIHVTEILTYYVWEEGIF